MLTSRIRRWGISSFCIDKWRDRLVKWASVKSLFKESWLISFQSLSIRIWRSNTYKLLIFWTWRKLSMWNSFKIRIKTLNWNSRNQKHWRERNGVLIMRKVWWIDLDMSLWFQSIGSFEWDLNLYWTFSWSSSCF